MLNYMKQEANITRTENGAAAYASSGSDCLDLFATVGALRKADDAEIVSRFIRAYAEDADQAMKLLFYARDVRGGLGERRVFRIILKWLADHKPESVRKNMVAIAEYGRFDDLLSLMDTKCEREAVTLLRQQFEKDMLSLKLDKPVSLLGKWLPSINASNCNTVSTAKKLARAFGLNQANYRKALTALRAKINIIENNLRVKDYTFAYEKQASRALFKYRQAFTRNDTSRYQSFLAKVSKGEVTLHAEHVMPYELVEPILKHSRGREISAEEEQALNATWASLPDFGNDENALAVIDTSGSMYWGTEPLPAAVALSLGLYIAERNKGAFQNHFIEFSEKPQLLEIKGTTFVDRLRYISTFNKVADTNLERVFELILNTAVAHNVKQEELPAKLIIISDMEFNECVRNASMTIFENAKQRFASHGYQLPQVVFWNVASRNRQQPVTMNEQGVALVSGATPRIFTMVAGGITSPYALMLEVVNSNRYAKIVA